jgi:hypothetical protein
MPETPVIVLGAGATKACGGPLTDEILPAALNGRMAHDDARTLVEDREELVALTRAFLGEAFNVPLEKQPITAADCPSLPMVLSMVRRSEVLGKSIGRWGGADLVKARRAMEYAIFAVIEAALRGLHTPLHSRLLEPLFARGADVTVVSLNYDVIVDNAMFEMAERYQRLQPPDYMVDISTPRYLQLRATGTFGRLLKIHGSLNWLFCERCKRLDLFISSGMRTGKALEELYHAAPFDDAYSCRGTPCRNRPACDGFVSPILITPTYVKDYENPHVERVWRAAEEALARADRAVVIGYSLPTDDVEVAMLLKNGLDHLPRDRITIVEYAAGDDGKPPALRTPLERHPTGQRFRSLFGPGLDWHSAGFATWLTEEQQAGRFPFAPA